MIDRLKKCYEGIKTGSNGEIDLLEEEKNSHFKNIIIAKIKIEYYPYISSPPHIIIQSLPYPTCRIFTVNLRQNSYANITQSPENKTHSPLPRRERAVALTPLTPTTPTTHCQIHHLFLHSTDKIAVPTAKLSDGI